MPDLARLRGRHLFLADLIIVALAIVGAMVLRFDTFRLDRSIFLYLPAALLPLLVRPPINVAAGLYSRAWAYASIAELARIVATVVAGSVALILVFYLVLVPLNVPGAVTEAGRFPRSFFVLEGLLSLIGFGAVRYIIRASTEWRPSRTDADTSRVPTLVYGAGEIGATVLRTVAASSDGLGMRIVGLIDDDPRKRNQVLRGVKVMGSISDLEEIARVVDARRLLIAIPSARGDVVRRAVEAATHLGLETSTVPAMDELVSGRLDAVAIREVRVEDLLRREPVTIDESALRDLIGGQTVLVTGAGGSIGSELSRQIFDLDPGRLVLLDRAEGPLYDIERELSLLADRDSGTTVRAGRPRATLVTRLANVASLDTMRAIVAADRPVLVLHAAAYKHVPMMEHHPADAVYTNIGGTRSALTAAIEAEVDRFVLVSTDKAVEPSSVMGATKRLAELAVAEAGLRTGRPFVSVRFGNVLGSSGSVVPLLKRQLAEGVPLTITHPDMTRFFMTIPEASRLILQAALIGQAGDLFVLDMGEPVRIVDLARDLARLAGRDPDSVPMRFIGLRPGEKLSEALFYAGETVEPTRHPKVMRATADHPSPWLTERLDELVAIGATGDHERARAALAEVLGATRAAPPPATVGSGGAS